MARNPDQHDTDGNGIGDACERYRVTPSAEAGGSIDPSTEQTVSFGASVSFTLTPQPGNGASVGGTCGGNLLGNTYATNAIDADCTVVATFAPRTYSISPMVGPKGSLTPATIRHVAYGTTEQFTVTPNPGYAPRIVGTCGGGLAGSIYTTDPITADCTFRVTFDLDCPLCLPSRGGWRAVLQ